MQKIQRMLEKPQKKNVLEKRRMPQEIHEGKKSQVHEVQMLPSLVHEKTET